MPITWKKSPSLKPEVVLAKIESVRSVAPGSKPSFTGFVVDTALPTLQSMLNFPAVADIAPRSTIMWKALASVVGPLTPVAFLEAINTELSRLLATRENTYHILTSVSISPEGLQKVAKLAGASLTLLTGDFPKRYGSREIAINEQKPPVSPVPRDYCKVIVRLKAKSHFAAMTGALRAIDLQRAAWCFYGNTELEIVGKDWEPINCVRLGGIHTVHDPIGHTAAQEVWFEPNFVQRSVHSPRKPDIFRRNCRNLLRRMRLSPYSEELADALVRYVRALDERDQNIAFLRLWGAIEALTSPDRADYDKVVHRCAFLFRDFEYHRQELEHLRLYRNGSVHAGDQGENAKTHCFQLQMYFRALFRFHLGIAKQIESLAEANEFLDTKPDIVFLKRRKLLVNKALRFLQ